MTIKYTLKKGKIVFNKDGVFFATTKDQRDELRVLLKYVDKPTLVTKKDITPTIIHLLKEIMSENKKPRFVLDYISIEQVEGFKLRLLEGAKEGEHIGMYDLGPLESDGIITYQWCAYVEYFGTVPFVRAITRSQSWWEEK